MGAGSGGWWGRGGSSSYYRSRQSLHAPYTTPRSFCAPLSKEMSAGMRRICKGWAGRRAGGRAARSCRIGSIWSHFWMTMGSGQADPPGVRFLRRFGDLFWPCADLRGCQEPKFMGYVTAAAGGGLGGVGGQAICVHHSIGLGAAWRLCARPQPWAPGRVSAGLMWANRWASTGSPKEGAPTAQRSRRPRPCANYI